MSIVFDGLYGKTEYDSMLDLLKGERVMSVVIREGEEAVIVGEECDGYYGVKLTRDQLVELIDELKDIAGKL